MLFCVIYLLFKVEVVGIVIFMLFLRFHNNVCLINLNNYTFNLSLYVINNFLKAIHLYIAFYFNLINEDYKQCLYVLDATFFCYIQLFY